MIKTLSTYKIKSKILSKVYLQGHHDMLPSNDFSHVPDYS